MIVALSGVPQDSVIGLLFSNLFIIELPLCVVIDDDCKPFKEVQIWCQSDLGWPEITSAITLREYERKLISSLEIKWRPERMFSIHLIMRFLTPNFLRFWSTLPHHCKPIFSIDQFHLYEFQDTYRCIAEFLVRSCKCYELFLFDYCCHAVLRRDRSVITAFSPHETYWKSNIQKLFTNTFMVLDHLIRIILTNSSISILDKLKKKSQIRFNTTP